MARDWTLIRAVWKESELSTRFDWKEFFPLLWRETLWQSAISLVVGCLLVLLGNYSAVTQSALYQELLVSIAGLVFLFNVGKLFLPLLIPISTSADSKEMRKVARIFRRIKIRFIRESQFSAKFNSPSTRALMLKASPIIDRVGEVVGREIATRIDLLIVSFRTASFLASFVLFFGFIYWFLARPPILPVNMALLHSLSILSTAGLSSFQGAGWFKVVESAQVSFQIFFVLLLAPLYLALYDRDKHVDLRIRDLLGSELKENIRFLSRANIRMNRKRRTVATPASDQGNK